MRRIKLITILALAILGPMVWTLGLAGDSASLMQHVGLLGSTGYALGISIVTAWLIVIFMEELRY